MKVRLEFTKGFQMELIIPFYRSLAVLLHFTKSTRLILLTLVGNCVPQFHHACNWDSPNRTK